jgi:hypothetical protein
MSGIEENDPKSPGSSARSGHEYLFERELERARVAPGRQTPDKPWWGVAVTVAGAGAGFGLALVAMGAIVMWVRLVAAGVPAEQGVGVMSPQSLAVVGAHVLLVPVLLSAAFYIALNYWWDVGLREHVQSVEAGQEPVRPLPLQRVQEIYTNALAATARAVTWVNAHRPAKIAALVVVIPLYPIFKLSELLSRYKLMVLWWVAAFPPVPSWIGIFVFNSLAWRWAEHVHATSRVMERSVGEIRSRVFAGFAVAAVLVALAGQFDRPSRLPPTTIKLTSGANVHGLFVTSDAQSVTIAVGKELRGVARRRISAVEVGQLPRVRAPESIEGRLFQAVF